MKFIIPLGDHCISAILLKELGLRTFAYPFDWTTHVEQFEQTNILYHSYLLSKLTSLNSKEIALEYIQNEDIWFPHDKKEEMTERYTRRFERLYSHLSSSNDCIVIMVTRCVFITPEQMIRVQQSIQNKPILFISGIRHPYLSDKGWGNIVFKYIYYDPSLFWNYDYTHFRPQVKEFLRDYLKEC